MLVGDAARAPHGRGDCQIVDESGGASQTGTMGNRLFLERGGVGALQFHVEESPDVSKSTNYQSCSSKS